MSSDWWKTLAAQIEDVRPDLRTKITMAELGFEVDFSEEVEGTRSCPAETNVIKFKPRNKRYER